ncbi:MAG: tocopherol cyclase family protein [Acidobacteriota bacterium]
MAVSVNPARSGAAEAAANRCRWDGKSAGHYEVWFLTFNQRSTGRGFWFRYTIEVPHLAQDPFVTIGHSGQLPHAELWATVFDRQHPEKNFGMVQTHAIDLFDTEKEQFKLRIEEATLTSSGASGRVENGEHTIAWDLRFTPNETTYYHVPKSLTTIVRPSSFVCSPNLDTRFSGVIYVDGEAILIDDEPGCQTHLWGSKHVDEWVWVHANAFEKNEGTVFEGLSARPRRAGRTLAPLLSLYLRHHDEEHHFTRMRFTEQWQHELGIGYWHFAALNPRVYIKGTAQCRLKDMLQVKYVDPDGEPLYCINSEVAHLKIKILRRVHGIRWRHVETIHAHATAHLEHAARSLDETVRMI